MAGERLAASLPWQPENAPASAGAFLRLGPHYMRHDPRQHRTQPPRRGGEQTLVGARALAVMGAVGVHQARSASVSRHAADAALR